MYLFTHWRPHQLFFVVLRASLLLSCKRCIYVQFASCEPQLAAFRISQRKSVEHILLIACFFHTTADKHRLNNIQENQEGSKSESDGQDQWKMNSKIVFAVVGVVGILVALRFWRTGTFNVLSCLKLHIIFSFRCYSVVLFRENIFRISVESRNMWRRQC